MVDIQTTVFTVANRSLSLDTVTVFSYTLYFMYNSSVPVASTAYKVYVGMNNLRVNFESHRALKKVQFYFQHHSSTTLQVSLQVRRNITEKVGMCL